MDDKLQPSNMRFSARAGASVERKRLVETQFKPRGFFTLEHIRDGKTLRKITVPNGVTDAGINDALDVLFDAGTQKTVWYLGLIDASGYTAVAAGDTMASHAGWTEFTAYSEANRPTWNPDPASGKVSVNSTTVDFNITGGAATLKGAFCTSNNTKAGTTGVLWATALFTADIPVTGGDLIKLTYTVQGA